MRLSRYLRLLLAPLVSLGCAACQTAPVNPSFPTTLDAARADLARMTENRKPLARPLVIVTGFMDPGFSAFVMKARFSALFGERRIIAISLGECFSFEGCRKKVIEAVDREFPTTDPARTTEVDVIGYSMGGVVARYAALGPVLSGAGQAAAPGRTLRIARLFTISSPNFGAEQAQRLPLLHPLQKDLRPGSEFLNRLNAAEPRYAGYAYIRLGDTTVGQANAALPGRGVWWVATPPLSAPHDRAHADPRILADIARRLRGEPPLATEPPAPLPGKPAATHVVVIATQHFIADMPDGYTPAHLRSLLSNVALGRT
jgi:pimeloyl-ACP methyl ester carboxylesterase